MLSLLCASMLVAAVKIQPVSADGTITINEDGSITPSTAPIQTADSVTYVFTANINDLIIIERDNITVDGNGHTLQGSGGGTGIYLSGRTNVTVENTTIKDFFEAIVLYSSNCNRISGNSIANNYIAGIYLISCSNNSICENNITSNRIVGIWLESSSSNNSISGNTFKDCGLLLDSDSYRNSVESNTVNGKPLVYLETVRNYSVGDAGQVILVRCDGIRVENLNLSDASVGLQLWETNDSVISQNNIANNTYYGIYLVSCSNNSICENNIINSQIGIGLYSSSSSNIIFHNNLIGNTLQVYADQLPNTWDNGYPSGGNCWSDFNGEDAFSGPYQNVTGSDGLGDSPYIIDSNNTDNYPLMKLFTTEWSGQTDSGLDIMVNCSDNVSVTFANVTQSGFTWVNEAVFEPFRPTGFILAIGSPVYYDIDTNASYSGNITISIKWDSTNMTDEQTNNLQLMHWDNATQQWMNVTTSVDTENNLVYGESSSLSPVAIMLKTVPGDINGDFKVDIYDAIILAGAFKATPASPHWNANTDINGDGNVDIYDAIILAVHFNQHYP
jgi:parallel beta-helix repeat protein